MDSIQQLIREAFSALEYAYVPYSGFKVVWRFLQRVEKSTPDVILKMPHIRQATVRRERHFSKRSVKENDILQRSV